MKTSSRQRVRPAKGQRGDILVVFLLAMAPTLLAIGLAVDLGSAYVAHAGISNAVDAGALAAVRSTNAVDMEDIALRVAKQNFRIDDEVTYTFSSQILSDSGIRVEITAEYEAPAYFSRLFGNASFPLEAVATAVRYPVDVTIVMDTSNSLLPGNVWTTLKDDTKDFLEYFDETSDRAGLVTFDTVAVEQMVLRDTFVIPGQQAINALGNMEDSNMGEALNLARAQINAATVRDDARRYVVLITDGRPNAYQSTFAVADSPTGAWSGLLAAKNTAFAVRGLFNTSSGDKLVGFDAGGADLYESNGSATASPTVTNLLFGAAVTDTNIRTIARAVTESHANLIRAADVTIFVVGILPPMPSFPLDTPDLEMLRRVANVDGMSSATQPQGEVLWSGPDDIDDMLAEVASKILTAQLVGD